MNGRIYDPVIAKMISPDPTVPFPDNLQAYNRYSYVMNRPLSLTDPSGFTPEEIQAQEEGSTSAVAEGGSSSEAETIQSGSTAAQKTIGQGFETDTARQGEEQILDGTYTTVESGTTGAADPSSATADCRPEGYDHPDKAAYAALNQCNETSINKNREYGGFIYEKNGAYYYTAPREGEETGYDLGQSEGMVPKGATVVGDYHTHGNYSIEDPVTKKLIATGKKGKDDFDADNFSAPDEAGTERDAADNPEYRAYLGTPSRRFRVYHPGGDAGKTRYFLKKEKL
jgi:hypothetical protein